MADSKHTKTEIPVATAAATPLATTPVYNPFPKTMLTNKPEHAHCDSCNSDVDTIVKLASGAGMDAFWWLTCCCCPFLCLCFPCIEKDLMDATHICPKCSHIIGQKKAMD